MHIPDGVLSNPVTGTGWVLCMGGVALGLRRLETEELPRVGVLGAVFFLASLISIPVPPASVHMLLIGLMGLVLHWAAFPAVLLALTLHAIQFGHGGFSTIGINTVIIALPAVLSGLLWQTARTDGSRFLAGALAMGAVALACGLQALALCLSGRSFYAPAVGLIVAHLPVMILDGIVTIWVVGFLCRVKPEFLKTRTAP